MFLRITLLSLKKYYRSWPDKGGRNNAHQHSRHRILSLYDWSTELMRMKTEDNVGELARPPGKGR